MDGRLLALLDELHRHGREHDAALEDRLLRLRNLEPETGKLLNLLVRTLGARPVLELGTSTGTRRSGRPRRRPRTVGG